MVKVGPKVQTLGPFLFHENSNPPNLFQKCFCLVVLRLVRISTILDHIWGSKSPKTSQKRPKNGSSKLWDRCKEEGEVTFVFCKTSKEFYSG